MIDDVEFFNTEVIQEPNKTYKLHEENVRGYVNYLEAYKQAVYKILNTERYEYRIYSWNYGVELKDLIGLPVWYVVPLIEIRITEAVMQDDRTKSVDSFEFDTSKKGVVHVTFRCVCDWGAITVSKDVSYV